MLVVMDLHGHLGSVMIFAQNHKRFLLTTAVQRTLHHVLLLCVANDLNPAAL